MIEVTKTRTGCIYVDRERKLEFLSVGDYGAENNIKADFLGHKREICGVKHKGVDLRNKWVVTISTQKGCPMKCSFCDCPTYGFHGNASLDDLAYQIRVALLMECVFDTSLKHTKRLNLHYARMGEPTFNTNVLEFTKHHLRELVNGLISAETIHPVVSTMMPKNNPGLGKFLTEWCEIKNHTYQGEAGLQLSINTTDEKSRSSQFNDRALSLTSVSRFAELLPAPVGRKYTLNFAVTRDTILDAGRLTDLFDREKFIVKITPIHQTTAAARNGFNVTTEYTDFDVYKEFEQPLLERGWDVIVFVPSKEEDEDRITCGNALLANSKRKRND